MSPRSMQPRSLAAMGDLEKRIADLEALVRQIPTRIGVPEVARSARWFYQEDHGLVPGDYVANDGTQWMVSSDIIQPNPGHGGVVERVTGNRFLVVFSGMIDTTGWDIQPEGRNSYSGIAIKPMGGNTAQVVQGPVTEYLTMVFFDRSNPMQLGKAIIGFSSVSNDGLVTSIVPTIGIIDSMEDSLPILHGGQYRAVLVDSDDENSHFRLKSVEVSMGIFPARFGEVAAVSGGLPTHILITDPTTGEYWSKPETAIGTGMNGIIPTFPTTTTVADAAIFPITMLSACFASEPTWTAGDILPILPGSGVTFVCQPSLTELRDVAVTEDPDDFQVLAWKASTKRWTPTDIFPTGGTPGQVATKTGSGIYDWDWSDPSEGAGSITLSFTAHTGIGFADGGIGPITADTFVLSYNPIDSSIITPGDVVKGAMAFSFGDLQDGAGNFALNETVYFPGDTKRNAIFVADETTKVPKWTKELEVGTSADGGAAYKWWYAPLKYMSMNITDGVTTWFEGVNNFCKLTPSTQTMLLQPSLNYGIELNGGSALVFVKSSASKYVLLHGQLGRVYAVGDGNNHCILYGDSGRLINTRNGVSYSGCDVDAITNTTTAPTGPGVKGQLHMIY